MMISIAILAYTCWCNADLTCLAVFGSELLIIIIIILKWQRHFAIFVCLANFVCFQAMSIDLLKPFLISLAEIPKSLSNVSTDCDWGHCWCEQRLP